MIFNDITFFGWNLGGINILGNIKSAFNITQNIDATQVPAKEGDIIEYHLITKNIGNGAEPNFVVSDDLTQILDNAKIISIGQNGRMEGNNVVYPAVDLGPGQRIENT